MASHRGKRPWSLGKEARRDENRKQFPIHLPPPSFLDLDPLPELDCPFPPPFGVLRPVVGASMLGAAIDVGCRSDGARRCAAPSPATSGAAWGTTTALSRTLSPGLTTTYSQPCRPDMISISGP